jgi:hypothetical protein
MKNELEMVCHKFGAVQVGYGFECVKHDGKAYVGNIVKVASYPRGTLVTVEWYPAGENQASYRSIYLEDCETWWVYVYNRETVS